MAEIIKKPIPGPWTIKHDSCGAIVKFYNDDKRYGSKKLDGSYEYFECPQCEKKISSDLVRHGIRT